MKHALYFIIVFICQLSVLFSQESIPFDTTHWDIQAQGHVFENFHGKDAIYINKGAAILKDYQFLNGTIEFDIFLTERRSFPGIQFRIYDDNNGESFYFRNHQSGNPDANQATPVHNNVPAWQLYFGEQYSFVYDYKFDQWTHVKLVVNGGIAQIFLDGADNPNLSWKLKNKHLAGLITLGGGLAPMHYANFKVDKNQFTLKDVVIKESEKIDGIISKWQVSDKFDEYLLDDVKGIKDLIKSRNWLGTLVIEENNAINISKIITRPTKGENTVFVKIEIEADSDGMKLLEFGYSDRTVLILNSKPIYKGSNNFRSRDYRYLGTIGLFDVIYLDLKKGKNILLAAVSESFGGWGFMGRIENREDIKITDQY